MTSTDVKKTGLVTISSVDPATPILNAYEYPGVLASGQISIDQVEQIGLIKEECSRVSRKELSQQAEFQKKQEHGEQSGISSLKGEMSGCSTYSNYV